MPQHLIRATASEHSQPTNVSLQGVTQPSNQQNGEYNIQIRRNETTMYLNFSVAPYLRYFQALTPSFCASFSDAAKMAWPLKYAPDIHDSQLPARWCLSVAEFTLRATIDLAKVQTAANRYGNYLIRVEEERISRGAERRGRENSSRCACTRGNQRTRRGCVQTADQKTRERLFYGRSSAKWIDKHRRQFVPIWIHSLDQ